jgi:hypothetical protein
LARREVDSFDRIEIAKGSQAQTDHAIAPRKSGAIVNPDSTSNAGASGRSAFMIL